jgi:hypothetical protein
MNTTRGQVLGTLALAATAGVPLLVALVRLRFFTFRDDFYGFNALGFLLEWTLALLLIGTALGASAWYFDRQSWLTRCAFGLNGLLLGALAWFLFTLS